MSKKDQGSNLLESKLGVLLELRNFISKQHSRDRFGHKLHPLIESNKYLYEIYNSKAWIHNFEILDSIRGKLDISNNLLNVEVVIKEVLTKSEINLCEEIFLELLLKLRISNYDFVAINRKFNLDKILELSAAAITHELTFKNKLKMKYGLLKNFN